MHGIAVRGPLGMRETQACERPQDPRGRFVIDLRQMSWCEPVGLVMVAALAGHASAQDRDVACYRPRNTNVANYLGRMRLGHVLDVLGAEHDLPVVYERPLRTSLVELSSLTNEDDCDAAAARVRDTTAAKCGDVVASHLYETLIEAVQNVVNHSQAPRGFVTAQAFPTKKIVKFAVADAGIGLRRSLSSRGADDDAEAIRLALAGTSRLDDHGRGRGFPTMQGVTAAAGGRLEVASGSARYDGRHVIGSQRWPVAGTLIQGALEYSY